MSKKIAVVGAGFSGAVIGRELAEAGFKVIIFEQRNHLAGNCHTERDAESNVMVHVYGPHIFHTNSKEVWSYINQYANFYRYINRVKATTNDRVFSFPINLLTINQFFNKTLSPNEAKNFIANKVDKTIKRSVTFEDQALVSVGKELYDGFFKHYTIKQWGVNPAELPASILKRLPIRFNYNDDYFEHEYQGIPENGYTEIVQKIIKHENIEIQINSSFKKEMANEYIHVFYTGTIDGYFGYEHGRLPYRTLDFVKESHEGDYQGCAVMNYCDASKNYTRITEHKHLAPWETHKKTIIYKEYSRDCEPKDIPYYPVRLVSDRKLLDRYVEKAERLENVSFIGRLGTYRYIDMDVTIEEALTVAKEFIKLNEQSRKVPSFFVKIF